MTVLQRTLSFDKGEKGGTEQGNGKALRNCQFQANSQVNLISYNTWGGISSASEEKKNEDVFDRHE